MVGNLRRILMSVVFDSMLVLRIRSGVENFYILEMKSICVRVWLCFLKYTYNFLVEWRLLVNCDAFRTNKK